MSYDDPKPKPKPAQPISLLPGQAAPTNTATSEISLKEGGTPVYKRILDLFEAEGIKTLFGIPDPNFVHLCLEAEARGWTVVSPHHEAAAGFMAEAAVAHHRQAGGVLRHARAGPRQHDARDPVLQGRELAGDLPRRPARARHRAPRPPRPHPVRPAGADDRGFGQVFGRDRICRPDATR